MSFGRGGSFKFRLVLAFLIGALCSQSSFAFGASPRLIAVGSENTEAKATILILHGLNLKPSKMRSLADALCKPDTRFRCLILELAGHEESSPSQMETVTADQWKAQVLNAIAEIKADPSQKGRPLFLVGYSLGGLLGTWSNLVDPSPSAPLPFQAQALIAPAISTRWYTHITPILPLPSRVSLPSKNHPDYRANSGTSLAAYRAMFSLIEETRTSSLLPRLNSVPTLVFLNPKDELVSETGTVRWMNKNQLRNWQTITLSELQSSLDPHYQHLMVDEASLGPKAWGELVLSITSHFNSPSLFTPQPSGD